MSKLRVFLDMMFNRWITEKLKKTKKSCLLLGPRQTGKSTLIRSLSPDLTINLAREQTFLEYSSQPELLERTLAALDDIRTVFIDEVQRIPSILNTIQAILDESNQDIKFYLTGSSARKLRRGHANLLPGRIHSNYLSPLLLGEVDYKYDLKEILSTGLLPGIFSEPDQEEKKSVLNSYAGTYLKEEIQAEALTKNIEGFSRFLFVLASRNGEFIDYSKLGTQANISQKTASRFFQILEDTLLVHRLDCFSASEYKRLIRHPKFYFFDVGVLNGLLGNYKPSEDRIGPLFETLVYNQFRSLAESLSKPIRFSTYRTESGAEVDLILEIEDQVIAVEIKASKNVGKNDIRGLTSFSDSYSKPHLKWMVYFGAQEQKLGDVFVFPLNKALQKVESLLRKMG